MLARLLICCCCLLALPAEELRLLAPLCTVQAADEPLPGEATHLVASVLVPEGAAGDLGAGFFLRDKDGRWFQQSCPGPLAPGRHELIVPLATGWRCEPQHAAWQPIDRSLAREFGIFFWSAEAGGSVALSDLRATSENESSEPPIRLTLDRLHTGGLRCGERWELAFLPQPQPANPYDPAQFSATLVVTRPDGGEERIDAFYHVPQRLRDRGDVEVAEPDGPARFRLRYRPRLPGSHRLRLEASWGDGARTVTCELPELTATGPAWDDYVRVDQEDHRFLSTGDGAFYWPVGMTISAPQDTRAVDRYGTELTPHRGTQSYEAYFERLARAGGSSCEIWLSTWNVGLEWSQGWPGFHGAGVYNQENAARLERLLDLAWARGIRLILTLDNHGKGKRFVETRKHDEGQWKWHPFRDAMGGELETASQLFDHPWAFAMQQRRYRYLMARYGDHPALMAWKLWSEVDLTDIGINGIRRHQRHLLPTMADWHRRAAQVFHQRDVYEHPVTTHFATHYRYAREEIVSLDEIDIITIDAYHRPRERWQARIMPQFLVNSLEDRNGGLGRYDKPVFATEFGGNHDDFSPNKIAVEHRIGHLGGFVSGQAASPMFWWFEWADQRDHWWPYQGASRFVAGEDLRGGRSVELTISGDEVWARAWAEPGRLLGYLVCETWATAYERAPVIRERRIVISSKAAAGRMRLEWWDADRGAILHSSDFAHPGGELALRVPSFRRHLAFKLIRLPAELAVDASR